MKRLYLSVILLFFCLATRAQYTGTFQADIKCGDRYIPMTFSYHPKHRRYVKIGESQYGAPAIDTTAVGRLVVPDSVSDASGMRFCVNDVGRQAFAHCSRLTEIVLPDGLQEIGDQAFVGCTRLREVTLPKALRVIYPFAFRDCVQLSTIRLHATNRPAVYDNIFDHQTLNRATLIIPAGTTQLYSNSLVWGMFHYLMEDFD